MKDKTRLGNMENVLHVVDESKTTLGNIGNVLHADDEGQNQARKYGECPSCR